MIIVKSRSHRKFLAVIVLLILNLSVMAKPWAAEDKSRWQLSVGLGLGIRTNPVMDNADIPLIILPQVSYQGDHFFIQNLDFGYCLYQNDKQQFNFLITPSYDQIFFNEWDISNFIDRSNLATVPSVGVGAGAGTSVDSPSIEESNRSIDKSRLHHRHMTGLSGLEYSQTVHDIDLQLQVLEEVTGYYNGNEIRFALSKNINLGMYDVKLTLGANWQNAATTNYFYGFPERESPGNFSYDAKAGLTSLLRFDWSYQLDEHWSLRFFTSYRHFSHSISDSPLVTKNNVITAFAGGVYHF